VSSAERADAKVTLLDMVYGLCTPQVMHVLVELDIAGLLAERPATAEELARQCGAHHPSLRRVLRAAVMLNLLDQDGPKFSLTVNGELLRKDAPDSVAEFVKTFTSPDKWLVWGSLTHTVRTGEHAYQHLFGQDYFEWLASHPEKSDRFNNSMAQLSEGVARAILAADVLGAHHRLIDVGGGNGALLAGLLVGHPQVRGVVYDTNHGLTQAEATLTAAGVLERCEIIEGDFFRSVPSDGDAYLLKHILHDWDDDQAATILRHCRQVMSPDARLYIVESVVPDDQDGLRTKGAPSVIRDLNMMLTLPGRERTEAEFSELLTRAGLVLESVLALPPPGAPYHLLVAHQC